jgi:hypothetical protein
MTGLEPEDEITSSEDLISLTEVRARIAYLKPYHVEDTRIPESSVADPTVEAFGTEEAAEEFRADQDEDLRPHLVVVTYTDEAEELTALRGLEAEMSRTGSERVSAINESYLRTVVEDDTEGMVGADATAVLGEYTDWARMTEDRKNQLTQITYRGTVFYLEP